MSIACEDQTSAATCAKYAPRCAWKSKVSSTKFWFSLPLSGLFISSCQVDQVFLEELVRKLESQEEKELLPETVLNSLLEDLFEAAVDKGFPLNMKAFTKFLERNDLETKLALFYLFAKLHGTTQNQREEVQGLFLAVQSKSSLYDKIQMIKMATGIKPNAFRSSRSPVLGWILFGLIALATTGVASAIEVRNYVQDQNPTDLLQVRSLAEDVRQNPHRALEIPHQPQSIKNETLQDYQTKLIEYGVRIDPTDLEQILQLIPEFKTLTVSNRQGNSSRSFIVETYDGELHFVKVLHNEGALEVLHEAATNKLANYLTGGLVPVGRTAPVGDGPIRAIEYPLIKIDHGFPRNPDPQDLTPKQLAQAFIHFTTDLLLDNEDAHSEQFAIDSEGNLIGFDKGRAEHSVLHSSPHLFSDKGEDFANYFYFYHELVDEAFKNEEVLGKILKEPNVIQMFERIEKLTQKQLVQQMAPLFTEIEQNLSGDSPTLKAIENSYFKRFRQVKETLREILR